CEHEHMPLRVHGHAGDLAEVHSGRQLEEVRDRVERNFGSALLRKGAAGHDEKQGGQADLLHRALRHVILQTSAARLQTATASLTGGASASRSGNVRAAANVEHLDKIVARVRVENALDGTKQLVCDALVEGEGRLGRSWLPPLPRPSG